nr:MAG TPA: hypothetical protein [Caudoviricetes sp.]
MLFVLLVCLSIVFCSWYCCDVGAHAQLYTTLVMLYPIYL